jgi:DMSO/TMAO reductase YedYZ molybdopterin-dependent catalytic subunit
MSGPKILPRGDAAALLAEARARLDRPSRRLFLRHGLSVGALALLTGCDIVDGASAERALQRISRWNDRVQAWLFDPDRLAPTFPESAITRPFPFNAFYDEKDAPAVDPATWRLELAGRIENRTPWTLAALDALPQVSQVTRHICIEGWSAIGKWSGVPFRLFLERIGADLRAPYVGFRCADNYSTSIDMASALHPQTQLALRFADEPLPRRYGFPARLRIPTKLGFKNPKHIVAITVTDENPGGFWERYGYNWFSGL